MLALTLYMTRAGRIIVPKQRRDETQVTDTIIVNGREAITVSGAQKILTQLAREIAEEHKDDPAFENYLKGEPREYSRYTVYRMLTAHHIDAIRTPSANYYYVDDLMKLKDKLNPIRGTRKDRKHYTPEQKEQALNLHRQGLKNREIARELNISYQTINNWVNAQRQASDSDASK